MHRSDLVGKRSLLILELDWAGGWKLSTEDAEIALADGTTTVVYGCLEELQFSEQLDAPGAIGEFDGVSVTATFPVDVAELVARGHRLELTTARVSRWAEGQLWEERELLFRGLVGDPEYGEDGDPVSFSVEPEDVVETRPCIPDDARVSSRTWDTDSTRLDEADVDVPYPTVIGNPGRVPWTSSGFISGTKGVWASKEGYWHKLIIAGHPVAATTVWINSDDVTAAEEVPVTHEADALGRVVALIDFHATDTSGTFNDYYQADGTTLLNVVTALNPFPANAYQVWISWPDGGGLRGEEGEVIRGAGDVLTWALAQCDIPADLGRCKAAAPLLNHIKIDGSIQESNGTMDEWIRNQLLPLLPVSIEDGADGRYPIVWRYEATERDAVAVIDLDVETDIDFGSIRSDSSLIRNEFVVRYGLSARVNTYQREHRLGHAVEEYATAVLNGAVGETILVTAAQPGTMGAGITINVVAGGALALTEDLATRTVTITFDSTVSTSTAVVNIIHSSSSLLKLARIHNPSGFPWGNGPSGQEQSRTTALHRSNGAVGSLICDVSQRRYARPSDPERRRVLLDELETDYLYDDASAASYARWKAAAFALAVRRLDIAAPGDRWGTLRRGDPVVVRRGSLYLDAVALVESRELHDDGVVAYTLRLLEDPSRDLHSL